MIKQSLYIAACGISLYGCTTTSYMAGNPYHSLDNPNPQVECLVQVFDKEKPSPGYQEIKKIETHINRNMFFGGSPSIERDAIPELKQKACALGGNGVIIDDVMQSSATEQGVLHVWATVIKS